MNSPLLKLFTDPTDAWIEIRRAEEDHPQQYLPRLLLLALIPALCLLVGTTTYGWSLAGEDRVRLSLASAAQLAGLLYATTVGGVMLMGVMIRWMSRGFDVQPNLNQCIGFAAYCATPWFVAGWSACCRCAGWRYWRCWQPALTPACCCMAVCRHFCACAKSRQCCSRPVYGGWACCCW